MRLKLFPKLHVVQIGAEFDQKGKVGQTVTRKGAQKQTKFKNRRKPTFRGLWTFENLGLAVILVVGFVVLEHWLENCYQ